MTDEPTLILPETIRRRLDPLMLVARNIRAGSMKGERRSIKRGTSIEFADYRNYTPGDDLRKLDWNVYARLEKPYVKLLEDEEDLAVHLLLDISASMDFPTDAGDETSDEAHNKLRYGQRLLASLAYMALNAGDRLMLTGLNDRGLQRFGPSRGRAQVIPMLRHIKTLNTGGVTGLNQHLRDYALRERRAGLVIVISDMFSADGYRDGLNALLGKGHEVCVIHLLAPDEVEPTLTGDLRLVDSETGTAQEVSVDDAMRASYRQRVTDWMTGIRDELRRKGAHYLHVRTDTPYEKVLLYDLRRMGLIK